MLTRCVRIGLSRRLPLLKFSQSSIALTLRHTRTHCSTSPTEDSDEVRTLVQLCVDRHYISPRQTDMELFRRGVSCSCGPLGMELRRNLLELWWHSVTRSTAQVFGINTMCSSKDTTDGRGHLRIVEPDDLKQILEQQELSKEELIQKVKTVLQRCPSVRTSFLQGALEQFVPSLELVNRKLPFGLAETGLCFQLTDGSAHLRSPRLLWCGSALLVPLPSGWITGHDRDSSGGGKWAFVVVSPTKHVHSCRNTSTKSFFVHILCYFFGWNGIAEEVWLKNRNTDIKSCFAWQFLDY